MTNLNYRRGRRKEYRIVKQLRAEGYDIVQRSAGSHSPVDVWAIDKENKRVLLVQVKPNTITKTKEEQLTTDNKELNGMYRVQYVVK